MFCKDVVVSGEGRADGHGDEHLACMKEADRRVAAGLCTMCSEPLGDELPKQCHAECEKEGRYSGISMATCSTCNKFTGYCRQCRTCGKEVLCRTCILHYQCCLKAVLGGKIVDGLVSMPTFAGKWYLNSLFVDPDYRRRGIADKLMEGMKGPAAQKTMVLGVKTDRPYLVEFYRRHGFEPVGTSRNHYGDGEDRFMMVRRAWGHVLGTWRVIVIVR